MAILSHMDSHKVFSCISPNKGLDILNVYTPICICSCIHNMVRHTFCYISPHNIDIHTFVDKFHIAHCIYSDISARKYNSFDIFLDMDDVKNLGNISRPEHLWQQGRVAVHFSSHLMEITDSEQATMAKCPQINFFGTFS